ncbi:hypothetical protein [Nocardia cyriacigeorgica]|uniref:hypothetical protein n=1 Tax=Nocardia cyriacigeorgica TaxID=135487 RepID=UPI0003140295|nr:hypothetical protein [Nocardia cyriacigeorgica]TLF54163.1 hypothetical protein FEK31_25060 [Nocardia cyriacigeorgica]
MAVYHAALRDLIKMNTPAYHVTDNDVDRMFADIHARLPAYTDPAVISAIEAYLFRAFEVIAEIIRDDEPPR